MTIMFYITFQYINKITNNVPAVNICPNLKHRVQRICSARDPGSIPGSRIFPEEGNGNPLQYSCLENSMGRGAWRATVHVVTKTEQLTNNFLELEMVTHSSFLAWRIPWAEEPGGLQSIGSQKVRHDWVTTLSLCICKTQKCWFLNLLKNKLDVEKHG